MATLIENGNIGLLAGKDGDEDVRLGMVLAKMSTKPALPVMYLHVASLYYCFPK